MGKREKKPVKVVTEATYDPEARRQWLTGFSKRKKERRMKGLAYGALKAREEKLAIRRARRAANPKPKIETPVVDAEAEAPAEKKVVEYDDGAVMDQWGSSVTVTTTLGLDVDSEDEERAARLENKNVKPAFKVDADQEYAGSLEAMKRKVAPMCARSAKSVRRGNRKRDANPHYKGGGTKGPDAKSLVDSASGKKSKKRKR